MPQSEYSFYPYGTWINTRLAISDNVPVATFLGTEGKSTSDHYNNYAPGPSL